MKVFQYETENKKKVYVFYGFECLDEKLIKIANRFFKISKDDLECKTGFIDTTEKDMGLYLDKIPYSKEVKFVCKKGTV